MKCRSTLQKPKDLKVTPSVNEVSGAIGNIKKEVRFVSAIFTSMLSKLFHILIPSC